MSCSLRLYYLLPRYCPHNAPTHRLPWRRTTPCAAGGALLVGNARYSDWPQLDDVPDQLDELQWGLKLHFDTVDVQKDLKAANLKEAIENFLRRYGNDENARLFIYYAGHGYTELMRDRNERRAYITGTDTPLIDGSLQAYDLARPEGHIDGDSSRGSR